MKLSIKGFRSLADTGSVELKPITVLIGKNSSGKSSFLRTLPMLKQSVEEKTKTPLLLYGNYVDFGSHSDIKPHKECSSNNYELGFYFDDFLVRRKYFKKNNSYQIDYHITLKANEDGLLYISKIFLNIESHKIEIHIDSEKLHVSSITVNDFEILSDIDEIYCYNSSSLVPTFYSKIVEHIKIGDKSEKVFHIDEVSDIIKKKLLEIIGWFVHGQTSTHTMWSIVDQVSINTDKEILDQLKKITYPTSWGKKISHWTVKSSNFQKIKNYIVAYYYFDHINNDFSDNLNNIFSNVKYVAPLRASAERYYRIQHLSVDEVDPNGKNLPMFIDSLPTYQRKKFNDWTINNFGFKVNTHKSEGHYSIRVIYEDNTEVNLSDTGFGYSQILPIVTQLWFSASVNLRNNIRTKYSQMQIHSPLIVAIEQPELHLHPNFQAKFAECLVSIIDLSRENNINLRLVIETHSDIIINQLGDCILNDQFDSDDLNIVIFEKETNSSPTKLSISKFDNEGNLTNWPIGFFQPDLS